MPGAAAAGGAVAERELARGPWRCQGAGHRAVADGADVCDPAGPLRCWLRLTLAGSPLRRSHAGRESACAYGAEVDWRFWVVGEPAVSAYRPHAPRKRPAPGQDRAAAAS